MWRFRQVALRIRRMEAAGEIVVNTQVIFVRHSALLACQTFLISAEIVELGDYWASDTK